MNAQLAAKTKGIVICKIFTSLLIANKLKSGNKRKVVAVLLVNSVNKEVTRAINNITIIRSNLPITFIILDASSANPVDIISEAIAKPPPNNNKTFQGTFLYQSNFKIKSFFTWNYKK